MLVFFSDPLTALCQNNIICRNSDGVYEGVAIGGDRRAGTGEPLKFRLNCSLANVALPWMEIKKVKPFFKQRHDQATFHPGLLRSVLG